MYSISNNNFICLTRGDTFIAPLFINAGNKMCPIRYKILNHPKAEIYLGVMEPNQPFERATIRKMYNSGSKLTKQGDIIIELRSTDTEYLLPGTYYYEVKVKLDDGNICTVVPKTEFLIME